MMNKPPMIITSKCVTAIINLRPMTADKSHGNYELIIKAIADEAWDDLEDLFDIKTALNAWSEDNYTITEDGVFYGDERLAPALESRVLKFFEDGIDFKYLLAFHKRLQANPSQRATQELYKFLEHESIPIDEEGYFYAYKSVRSNWMDHHSNSCDNHVGNTLEMARNAVDDDANRGCSKGYHVGSLAYASSFGSFSRGGDCRLLICKIDPADVVSVPHDCAHQKVRTCKYTVIAQYTGPLPETTYNATPIDECELDFDDDFEDDFEGWEDEVASIDEEIRDLQEQRDALIRDN